MDGLSEALMFKLRRVEGTSQRKNLEKAIQSEEIAGLGVWAGEKFGVL